MAYLLPARALLALDFFREAGPAPDRFFLALLFSVSPCLRGETETPPSTNAALTHTTAGSPSRIACQLLPSSFDAYTLPLLVPK
jgi:hypothetical protein